MSDDKLKQQVEAALARIPTITDAKRLKAQYLNIMKHQGLDELQREQLIEATMQQMRKVIPAAATRLGGPKDAEARDFLQAVYDDVATRHVLIDNHVKNGVKIGGSMLSGEHFVAVYISYKNAEKLHLGLAWIQVDANTAPYLQVRLYRAAGGIEELVDEKFDIADKENAAARYEGELVKLLS